MAFYPPRRIEPTHDTQDIGAEALRVVGTSWHHRWEIAPPGERVIVRLLCRSALFPDYVAGPIATMAGSPVFHVLER